MKGELTLNFRGTVRYCDLPRIYDVKGRDVSKGPVVDFIDITNVPVSEVIAKVNSGEWALSLEDVLGCGEVEDVVFEDIEEEK